ncbi:S41 family peptidase [Alteromonas lipolytica]|uniref:Uncharacterized protein n=1 Tax=Alteromonas lipolytica TaxID=1856405 RepID=A0A1E8FH54_9ALTE|nr:S41 family peptidase [Alteromonas lipolytica]OFI34928.1 hypothetical protein BFC17_15290 [Alteromonas lipolytica]GGF55174.1 hypothetical protein GCM10011338_04260 [Alteromonas lipolytica]
MNNYFICFSASGFSSKIKNVKRTIYICLFLSFSNVAWGLDLITEKQWREDINVYVKNLEQGHINLFHTVDKANFYKQLARLQEQLPKLSENEVLVKLMELTRTVDDGHTSFPLWGPKLHKFPVKLIAIDQRLFVNEATINNQGLLKSELVSINGKPIKEIFNTLAKLVPFSENPYSTQVRVAQYLPMAEVLNGLGIIEPDYTARFTFKSNGKIIRQDWLANVSQSFIKAEPLGTFKPQEKLGVANKYLWFASSANKESVYVKFERYTSLDRMENFASSLLAFINKNQSKNLILDLRNNFGGDFFVGLKLAQHLVLADSLNWRSGIYVLINNVTFSAAMSNAAQFKSLLNAELVGEPTGAKPKGYQDMGEFTLPHSSRVVTYSKRHYDFTGNSSRALFPDKLIKQEISDYLNNIDKQLQWILEQVGWYDE